MKLVYCISKGWSPEDHHVVATVMNPTYVPGQREIVRIDGIERHVDYVMVEVEDGDQTVTVYLGP